MDKLREIQRLFNNKEKIVRGYKKVHPLVNVGGANVESVTSGLRVNIVDPDDNVLTTLSVSQANHYMRLGE